jgi:hypothetical protein
MEFPGTTLIDGGTRPNSGGAPFRQPCPAYPSADNRRSSLSRTGSPTWGERHRRNASARKSPDCTSSEDVFLKSFTAKFPAHTAAQKTHSVQQAWMNSRNPFTIASVRKHRQLVFLHPTVETGSGHGFVASPC